MRDSKQYECPRAVLNLSSGFAPIDGAPISFESFKFPGGELHIKIAPANYYGTVWITSRLNSSDDLMLLCLAVDALRRLGATDIRAFLPYLPYARQDRAAVRGEALSLKVVAGIINNLELAEVAVYDPHSDVATALLNNVRAIDNSEFVRYAMEGTGDYVLVSPDAGAQKKIFKLAQSIGYTGEILTGSKHRDVKTGDITHTDVDAKTLDPHSTYVIVDDICDGGRTFNELAKVMKCRGAKNIWLLLSHGIFSQGFEELEKNFSSISTTDSISSNRKAIPFNRFLTL